MSFGKLGARGGFGSLGGLGGAGNLFPSLRAPNASDNAAKGYVSGNEWQALGRYWVYDGTTWNETVPATKYPLDAVATSPVCAYGTIKGTANTNVVNCLDVWLSTDQSTHTIGWAGDFIDAATLDALAAPVWAAKGTVQISKVYDQSAVGANNTGALNGNDRTVTPGYVAMAPGVSASGTGGVNGTAVYQLVGGTGTPATLNCTWAAGVLTINSIAFNGSYAVMPFGTASGVNIPIVYVSGTATGWSGAKVNVSTSQHAPLWTPNKQNGHRVINFNTNFMPDPTVNGVSYPQWMLEPAGVSQNLRTVTVIGAIQARALLDNAINTFFSIGTVASLNQLTFNQSATQPGMGMLGTAGAGIPETNPAIWTVQTGAASTAIRINNENSSVTVAEGNTVQTAGAAGAGTGNRFGNHDELFFAKYNATLSASDQTKFRASLSTLINTTLQTVTNHVVMVDDSTGYGFESQYGNSPIKFAQMNGNIPSSVLCRNFCVPGAQFSGGAHNYTSSFSTDWANVYSASIPNLVVVVGMGTNDIGAGGKTGAQTYALAQTYCGLVLAQGSNIKLAVCTLFDRTDISDTEVLAYNALVRASALLPIGSGGLGASAICDFGSIPGATSNLVQGLHPNDTLNAQAGVVLGAAVAPLLLH